MSDNGSGAGSAPADGGGPVASAGGGQPSFSIPEGTPLPGVQGAEPAAPAAPAATEAPPGSLLDADLEEGIQQFSRAYVEDLRREAAQHREAARRAAFLDAYDDRNRDALTDLFTRYADPNADEAALYQDFQTIADSLKPQGQQQAQQPAAQQQGQQEQVTDETVQGLVNEFGELDTSKLTSFIGQQVAQGVQQAMGAIQQEQALTQRVESSWKMIEDAGYGRESDDAAMILSLASRNGDLAGAIEKYRGHIQAQAQALVAGKQQTPSSPPVPGAAPTPSTEVPEPAKDWKGATRNIQAWLASQPGQA